MFLAPTKTARQETELAIHVSTLASLESMRRLLCLRTALGGQLLDPMNDPAYLDELAWYHSLEEQLSFLEAKLSISAWIRLTIQKAHRRLRRWAFQFQEIPRCGSHPSRHQVGSGRTASEARCRVPAVI